MTPMAHISVAKEMGSKLTTSGATNSGVPNKTCNFLWGSCMRASPKSIILMRFPDLVKHKMFSGCNKKIRSWTLYFPQVKLWKRTFKSRWRMCFECMKETPSRICFMKHIQAFSVRTNSSSITRSNSSPPGMLWDGRRTTRTYFSVQTL